jgi:hypothetical protein
MIGTGIWAKADEGVERKKERKKERKHFLSDASKTSALLSFLGCQTQTRNQN